jgi:N-methylhydantoinase A/oxoprolinase/acetone carboxylase beta subunit
VKRIGVDIGGTFTDIVLYDSERNRTSLHKVLTTPHDLSQAVIEGIKQLLEQSGTDPGDVRDVTYGTTAATNAVLERRGPATALLTTEGFRDVLIIQRQSRYDLFDLFIDKPRPLLRRRDIFEVAERIGPDGEELEPLDERQVEELGGMLKDAGVEAVAISFLHAYRNDRHERRTAELIQAVHPNASISLRSQVSPLIGEYEATNTTVTDAFVKPITKRHIEDLERRLVEMGITAKLSIMLSDGGVSSVERANKAPVRMIESGPAAGVQIAAFIGSAIGTKNVIAFDMGGTTAKVALVENGRPLLSDQLEVDRQRMIPGSGLPLTIPAVDLIEIGSGGGSIASVERSTLKVGPESAGAAPGPACYKRGGARPTVTDADLLLGYLDPDFFLGGKMPLDIDAARGAVTRDVATPLGLSLEAAARGIYAVINSSMEHAIRAGTVQRGRDPRDYALVATGGAAPVHAAAVARSMGVPRVVFAPASGVASALGLLAAEPRTTFVRSRLAPVDPSFVDVAREEFTALAEEAKNAFARDLTGGRSLKFRRRVSLRFVGQGYDLPIDLTGSVDEPVDVSRMVNDFYVAYEALFTQSERSSPVEATKWRLDAVLDSPLLRLEKRQTAKRNGHAAQRRRIYDVGLNEDVDAQILRSDELAPGELINGPAVIEQTESTAVIFTGDRATVDEFGNIIVEIAASPKGA